MWTPLSVAEYFSVKTPWDVVWAHGTNNSAFLKKNLFSSDVMMMEGDISRVDGSVIMAHPPITESDLKFRDWFSRIIETRKGAKFDFKDFSVVSECLEYVSSFEQCDIPVFLNADIISVPRSAEAEKRGREFIALCGNYCPQAILSIGVAPNFDMYKNLDADTDFVDLFATEIKKHQWAIFEMALEYARAWAGHTTICLCSSFLKDMHLLIKKFLFDADVSMTLWNFEPVSLELASWIKDFFPKEKTFYDFKDEQGYPFII